MDIKMAKYFILKTKPENEKYCKKGFFSFCEENDLEDELQYGCVFEEVEGIQAAYARVDELNNVKKEAEHINLSKKNSDFYYVNGFNCTITLERKHFDNGESWFDIKAYTNIPGQSKIIEDIILNSEEYKNLK
jgi:hypothetical protein